MSASRKATISYSTYFAHLLHEAACVFCVPKEKKEDLHKAADGLGHKEGGIAELQAGCCKW